MGVDRSSRVLRSAGKTPFSRLLLPPLLIGLAVAAAVVGNPAVALVSVGGLTTAFVTVFLSRRWPRRALAVGPFLILAAETKFRVREPTASLAATVDAQILFEIGMYGIAGLVAATVFWSTKGFELKPTRIEAALFAYALLAVLSSAWSDSPAFSIVRGLQTVILLIFAFVSVRVLGARRLLAVLRNTMVAFVLLMASMAVMLPFANGSDVGYLGTVRFSWFAMHPATAAILSALGFMLLLPYLLLREPTDGPRHTRPLLWVALAALFVILVSTRTRAPIFAVTAASSAIVFWKVVPAQLTALTAVVVTMLGTAVLLFGASPLDYLTGEEFRRTRVATFVYRNQDVSQFTGLTGRVELWSNASQLARSRPLHGHGFQASRAKLLEIAHWAGQAHNGPLQSVLDLGGLGLVLLWGSIFLALLKVLRRDGSSDMGVPRVQATALGLLIVLLLNSVTSPSVAGPPGTEVFLGFVIVVLIEHSRRSMTTEAGFQASAMSGQEP